MQPRTCLPSAFALSAAMFVGISAIAADLPKEGNFKGFYSASGTIKRVPLGKERVFAGISGTITVVHHGNEFRTAVDGTFATYDTIEGNYKLP